jgi:hypothetical protein
MVGKIKFVFQGLEEGGWEFMPEEAPGLKMWGKSIEEIKKLSTKCLRLLWLCVNGFIWRFGDKFHAMSVYKQCY